jgi:protein-disulfide isomerase
METITKVLKNYSAADKVCIIYHEFPLERNSLGRHAARFSLAAQRIGRKQWLAVIDALYTKQSQWTRDGKIDVALIGAVSTEDLIRIRSIAREPYIEQAIERNIALET